MKTPAKLGSFAVVLAGVFTVAVGVGNAVGPIGPAAQPVEHAGGHPATHNRADGPGGSNGHLSGDHAEMAAVDTQPGGLVASEHGYTLTLDQAILSGGDDTRVAFRVLGPDGNPVTDFEETHDKELHFVAIRRDTTGFQHVHPTRTGGGAWRTELDLTAGTWRFFADFQPSGHGEPVTLGTDAFVAGDFDPEPLPAPVRTARVGDYTVTLGGTLIPGKPSKLTLRVLREGKPVTDLEPYLAAYGHLVALRAGDLAYLHVHPEGAPGDGSTKPGPRITFYATAPSAGAYRLFLDFKHDGVVRTAEFTDEAAGGQASTRRTGAGENDKTVGRPESDTHGGHSH